MTKEEKAEKNRRVALEYYYAHQEKYKAIAREKYRQKKAALSTKDEKMEYAAMMSDRTALYYAHRLLKELSRTEGYDSAMMQELLRDASIRYMYDPETMRRHIETMMKRRHRVPTENARKISYIIREAVMEYKSRKRKGHEQGRRKEEVDDQ